MVRSFIFQKMGEIWRKKWTSPSIFKLGCFWIQIIKLHEIAQKRIQLDVKIYFPESGNLSLNYFDDLEPCHKSDLVCHIKAGLSKKWPNLASFLTWFNTIWNTMPVFVLTMSCFWKGLYCIMWLQTWISSCVSFIWKGNS